MTDHVHESEHPLDVLDINGTRVYVDFDCVEKVDVERSLKERWLSWPWRPWVKIKIEQRPAIFAVMNPTPGGLFAFGPDRFILAHP